HRALTRAIAAPKFERGLTAPHHNDWRLFMTTSARLALAAAILVALPAAAQADPKFGVRLGYYTKVEDPFIGAELLFRIVPDLYFNPNVEAVLVDNARYLTINGDFHYDLPPGRPTSLWAGPGRAATNPNPEGPAEGHTAAGTNP